MSEQREKAIARLLDYAERVESDICDQDTGWFYQFSSAIEKLRNLDHKLEQENNHQLK